MISISICYGDIDILLIIGSELMEEILFNSPEVLPVDMCRKEDAYVLPGCNSSSVSDSIIS